MGFYETMLPYAKRVQQEVGQPVAVTLAQWALESARGTSTLFKASNNVGGVKYSPHSKVATVETSVFPEMRYAHYKSLNDYATDFIRVLKLPYYDDLRESYKTNNTWKIVKALDDSPYAEDTKYYSKIMGIIEKDNLWNVGGVGGTISVGGLYKSSDQKLNGKPISEVEKYALIGIGVLGVMALFDN